MNLGNGDRVVRRRSVQKLPPLVWTFPASAFGVSLPGCLSMHRLTRSAQSYCASLAASEKWNSPTEAGLSAERCRDPAEGRHRLTLDDVEVETAP
jgi:hypothetical protein